MITVGFSLLLLFKVGASVCRFQVISPLHKRIAMSSTHQSRPANPKPPLQCLKNTTDTKGMQTMLERYTNHMPKRSKVSHMSKSPKTLVVIGSTGFLGPHIIASLLSEHKDSDIFCLNRSSDARQRTELALQQLGSDYSRQSPRLHFWPTDMTQPNFGLSILQAGLLASQVDELIFNAWDPHWGKKLAYFDPFLGGIRNAIDFCASASRRPRITFISSICAVGDWPLVHPREPAIPEAVVWDNRSAMSHGYGESKCVAEQMLAKAHEVSGIPVNIVRAGQIGGPSIPSMGAWTRQGWLYSIMMASKRLGTFPTHVVSLNWIPVDVLAKGIASCTMRRPNSSDVEVFNALHPDPASWSLLCRTLRSSFGLQAEEESLPKWLARLNPNHMKIYGFLSTFGNGREYNMKFRNQKALEVLPSVPSITEEFLARWLANWKLTLGDSTAKL
jgi:thioester reductase-like protein